MAQDGTLCHTFWFSFDCFSNYGLQVFSLDCIYKFPLALAQLGDKLWQALTYKFGLYYITGIGTELLDLILKCALILWTINFVCS